MEPQALEEASGGRRKFSVKMQDEDAAPVQWGRGVLLSLGSGALARLVCVQTLCQRSPCALRRGCLLFKQGVASGGISCRVAVCLDERESERNVTVEVKMVSAPCQIISSSRQTTFLSR